MKKYCSLLLLLAISVLCNGQGKSRLVKTQGTNEYAAVGCGLLDRAGNLWFGTGGEGVYRYDGRSFTNFTEQDGLCSNFISAILEDKNGSIWFGTNKGLCRYDPMPRIGAGLASEHQLKFTDIAIPSPDSRKAYSFAGNSFAGAPTEVFSILQDRKGKIWFGTYDGVYCYDPSVAGPVMLTRFLDDRNIVNKSNISLKAVTTILEDKRGNIWFTTWFEGICRFDGKTLTNFKPNKEVWYSGILEDRSGKLWFGRREKGVCRYDPSEAHDAGTVNFANILQHGIFDSCAAGPIIEDKEGNIWFCTEHSDMTERERLGGAWRYDGKSFRNFTLKDGLTNMSVFSANVDRSGKIWFGTRNMGLCCYDPSAPHGKDGKAMTRYSE